MFNKVAIVLTITASILISSCSESSSDATVSNSVVGTWSFTYQSSGCVESYTYNNDGTWSATALNEVQTGTYTFNETVNIGGRHSLSMVIATDNGLPDCNGLSSDSSGVSGTLYVTFPDENTMNWFLSVTGSTPDQVLTKQ